MRTDLEAPTERYLNEAAVYFASAVTKIGVNAIMAFQLKNPLCFFRDLDGFEFKNVSKAFWTLVPAPGSVPAIEFKPIPDSLGTTSAYDRVLLIRIAPLVRSD